MSKRFIKPITDDGAVELAAAIISAIREDYGFNIKVVIRNYPYRNFFGTAQFRDYWINVNELKNNSMAFDSEYYDVLTLGHGNVGKEVRSMVEKENQFDEFKEEHPDWDHELDIYEVVNLLAKEVKFPDDIRMRIARNIVKEIKHLNNYISDIEANNRNLKRMIKRLEKKLEEKKEKKKTPSVGEIMKKEEQENE